MHGQLAKIKWDPPPGDHLVCFKWTLQEQLVAVFEKGCVAVYDVHGKSIQRTLVLEASVREFKLGAQRWIPRSLSWPYPIAYINDACCISVTTSPSPHPPVLPVQRLNASSTWLIFEHTYHTQTANSRPIHIRGAHMHQSRSHLHASTDMAGKQGLESARDRLLLVVGGAGAAGLQRAQSGRWICILTRIFCPCASV